LWSGKKTGSGESHVFPIVLIAFPMRFIRSEKNPLYLRQRPELTLPWGQVNTSYKDRFLVLNHDVLEYYEDVATYIQGNTGTNLVSKVKGSLYVRCLQVSPSAQDGVNKSSDGYHFTLTYQESGFSPKIIEFACMDEEGRDKWVQKIREANAAVCIHSHFYIHTIYKSH